MNSSFLGKVSMVKILVPIKRVLDYNVKVRVKLDQSGVDLTNVKMSMNPFDEIAVEEAVRLKEKGLADEIVVISLGTAQTTDILRAALAMGADRATLLTTEAPLEPLAVAKVLKAVCDTEKPDLVIMGKQAIDDDYNQTGQMLSALLNWSQATFASSVTLGEKTVTVVCEVDGGLQTVSMPLPAVITTDLRLNEPRYASLPNIMKAKKKPLEEKALSEYGIDVAPRLTVLKVSEPARRTSGIVVKTAEEFVTALAEKGVLS
jgi:electron transfer flavoprotein beta subunit